MFKDTLDGKTYACSHTTNGSICDACLGRAADVIGVNVSGTTSRRLTKAEQIREIWEEMKKLKRLREGKFTIEEYETEERERLEYKFAEVETLFGHIQTETKAIIYYLQNYGSK